MPLSRGWAGLKPPGRNKRLWNTMAGWGVSMKSIMIKTRQTISLSCFVVKTLSNVYHVVECILYCRMMNLCVRKIYGSICGMMSI